MAWGRRALAKARSSSGLQKVSLSSLADPSSAQLPTVHSESLSDDRRRVKRTTIPVADPPSPVKKRLRSIQAKPTVDQLTDVCFGEVFKSVFSRLYSDDELAAAAEETSATVVTVEEVQTRRRYQSSVRVVIYEGKWAEVSSGRTPQRVDTLS
ncbi:hypothetical protein VKT23_016679 [Stygiomarasmius scandens]|uniref:Uncharacterized protein n=1 Tax=Marasmiellus scandens TaxID=2682957 RepID=A0ABR1IU53_9AGAR